MVTNIPNSASAATQASEDHLAEFRLSPEEPHTNTLDGTQASMY